MWYLFTCRICWGRIVLVLVQGCRGAFFFVKGNCPVTLETGLPRAGDAAVPSGNRGKARNRRSPQPWGAATLRAFDRYTHSRLGFSHMETTDERPSTGYVNPMHGLIILSTICRCKKWDGCQFQLREPPWHLILHSLGKDIGPAVGYTLSTTFRLQALHWLRSSEKIQRIFQRRFCPLTYQISRVLEPASMWRLEGWRLQSDVTDSVEAGQKRPWASSAANERLVI